MTSKLERINLLIISATFIILPIFTLPITSDYVEITKSFFIVLSTTIAFFLATINFFCGNYSLRLPSKIFIGLLAFTELLLFSSLLKSQSIGTSLSSFNFYLLVFMPLLFILIGSVREKITARLKKIMIVTGIVTAIIGIAFYSSSVNIIGSQSQASIFFAIIIIFCVNGIRTQGPTFCVNPTSPPHLEGVDVDRGLDHLNVWRQRETIARIICLILAFLSLFISIKIPQPLVLDFKTAFEIFLSTFRDFPLFGIGPELYKTAFHLYKPLNFNSSEFAFLEFNQGSNFWLTLSTQYGALLALCLLSLFILISLSIVKTWFFRGSKPITQVNANFQVNPLNVWRDREKVEISIDLSFLLLFASSFFLNFGPTLLYLLFFFAALNLPFKAVDERNTLEVRPSAQSPGEAREGLTSRVKSSTVLMFLAITLFLAYSVSVNFLADAFYEFAANGKSQKDETTFTLYNRAIALNPRSDIYRRSLAEGYLSLATVLKNQKELPSEKRTEIEVLIKKSLIEAKAAVDINPFQSDNYRTAGLIYTSLIGVVTDAAGEGKRLLERAISLNPYNPILRVDLATLYAANGQEETAMDIIKGALKLKGDYVAGRYQLARLLTKLRKYREAREEYRLTLNLIGNRNLDLYQKIEKEMGEIPH